MNGCTPEDNRTTCASQDQILKSCINCDELVRNVTKICGLDGEAKYGGLCVKKSEDPGR